MPNAEKRYDVAHLPDKSQKVERRELPNGVQTDYDVTFLLDGTQTMGRSDLSDDVTGSGNPHDWLP